MKRERETAPSPSDEPAFTPREHAPASAMAPSDPEPSDPEPSDPDAAMYAAIRARPNWLEKPKVKQLIQELSEGLGPGEDLFYWDMRRTKPAKPSDAEEHRIVTVHPSTAGLAETLPSARVIVQEPHAGRPSPGRNGPRRPLDGAAEPGTGLPRSPSHRPPSEGSSPRWFAAKLLGAVLASAALCAGVVHVGSGRTDPAAAAVAMCPPAVVTTCPPAAAAPPVACTAAEEPAAALPARPFATAAPLPAKSTTAATPRSPGTTPPPRAPVPGSPPSPPAPPGKPSASRFPFPGMGF